MKTFTIIAGVNGVGKTSFLGVLKEKTTVLGHIIDVDNITAELGGDPAAGKKAALTKMQFCMERSISFTLVSSLSDIIPEETLNRIRESGYHVHLIYIALHTVEDSLGRIENRVRHGGYGAATDAVIQSFENRWNAVAHTLPYCDEAKFFDNHNGFAKIAGYQSGELQLFETKHPQWVDELLTHLSV